MEISRRRFLSMSGAIGSGVALSSLGSDLTVLEAHASELSWMDRIRTARQSISICCYCYILVQEQGFEPMAQCEWNMYQEQK
ncbi:MAG: twin-arginine translocation signal domain-containing protein [Desulfobulbaceae bacterium]|nr:MAG: twin-arginine translocation signal domain-containing protein [Desulfobulbaceae bacterium]